MRLSQANVEFTKTKILFYARSCIISSLFAISGNYSCFLALYERCNDDLLNWQNLHFLVEQSSIVKQFLVVVQVHITQGDYDGKSVIISWVTESEPGTSEVWYGTVEHEFEHKAEGKNTNYTFYNYKSGYIHHCLVDGLEVLIYHVGI